MEYLWSETKTSICAWESKHKGNWFYRGASSHWNEIRSKEYILKNFTRCSVATEEEFLDFTGKFKKPTDTTGW
jgi:hypothetical protein